MGANNVNESEEMAVRRGLPRWNGSAAAALLAWAELPAYRRALVSKVAPELAAAMDRMDRALSPGASRTASADVYARPGAGTYDRPPVPDRIVEDEMPVTQWIDREVGRRIDGLMGRAADEQLAKIHVNAPRPLPPVGLTTPPSSGRSADPGPGRSRPAS
jgi:hypothetical protein